MDETVTVPVLRFQDLQLAYRQGPRRIQVLDGASGQAFAGEAIALLGPSGAGKSSLLHIIGLLDRPDAGAVFLEGDDGVKLSDGERTRMRRTSLGFIYQFHHLLPEFSALENVALPQLIMGRDPKDATARAQDLLQRLGLADRLDHRPAELSGGEQQRVAIARAVANGPKVLLADEPTGNLDPHTAEHVFQQLIELVHNSGLTAIIATHNLELARRMNRVWRLEEGELVEIVPAKV